MSNTQTNAAAATETPSSTGAGVHPFERAKLGLAPFRYVGHTEEVYIVAAGTPDAHAVPGASCDYCGTAIRDCFWILSADRKKFKVGCDCVHKLERADNRLVSAVERANRELQKQRRHAREAARIAAAREKFDRPEILAALEARPHPHAAMAEKGHTAADYCRAMFQYAGNKGMIEAARVIEAAEPATAEELAAAAQKRAERAAAAEAARANDEAWRAQRARELAAWDEAWRPVVEALEKHSGRSEFARSVASELRAGHGPRGRGLTIALEIYAQQFGRRNSAAFNKAFDEISARVEAAHG